MSEFLLKNIEDPEACNFIIKRLQHEWFPVKFTKFLRAPFYTDTVAAYEEKEL